MPSTASRSTWSESCLWVGGLAALLLVSGRLGDQLPTVVAATRRLAGWCFLTWRCPESSTLRSGSARSSGLRDDVRAADHRQDRRASARSGSPASSTAASRIRRLDRHAHKHWFARLATVELVVMAGTIGLAVALSQSAPPVPDDAARPGLGAARLPGTAAADRGDVLHRVLSRPALAGRRRRLRRAATWPARSGSGAAATAGPARGPSSWLAGCLVLVVVTSGGIGVYGRLHFSTHMLQHMMLMIVVPFCWVVGAPITLALRALGRAPTAASARGRRCCGSSTPGCCGCSATRCSARRSSSSAWWRSTTAPVPAGDVHPRRPRADDGALPAGRVPVRLVADRHRPGPGPAAVRLPAGAAADGDGLPRDLRDHADVLGHPAGAGLVARARLHRRRGAAGRPADAAAASPGVPATCRRSSWPSRCSWSGSAATSGRAGGWTGRPTGTAMPSCAATTASWPISAARTSSNDRSPARGSIRAVREKSPRSDVDGPGDDGAPDGRRTIAAGRRPDRLRLLVGLVAVTATAALLLWRAGSLSRSSRSRCTGCSPPPPRRPARRPAARRCARRRRSARWAVRRGRATHGSCGPGNGHTGDVAGPFGRGARDGLVAGAWRSVAVADGRPGRQGGDGGADQSAGSAAYGRPPGRQDVRPADGAGVTGCPTGSACPREAHLAACPAWFQRTLRPRAAMSILIRCRFDWTCHDLISRC